MESPLSCQDRLLHVSSKHKKMLDVAAPQKHAEHVAHRSVFFTKDSFRDNRVRVMRVAAASRRCGFDGIRVEKHTFLKQLKKQSFRDFSWRIFRKGEIYYRFAKRTVIRLTPNIAPHKMFYGSLVGGVAFGIVSMGFIEHFFGPGVFARSQDLGQTVTVSPIGETAAVASVENADTKQPDYNFSETDILGYFNDATDAQYEATIRKMVKGYPIEKMLPYIFEQDRLTSAFLIGIARKESNWGKRVPVLDGQDCLNYWGYRGIRRLMGSGGHTCFNSSKDAVETVAKRLNTLIYSQKLNTPEKMIVWKCGFSCSGHSVESVKKWISDVDYILQTVQAAE